MTLVRTDPSNFRKKKHNVLGLQYAWISAEQAKEGSTIYRRETLRSSES